MAHGELVEAWAERYGREIHAFLWRMLDDPQDAEDCLQEAFLKAMGERGRSPIREPRAWLYTVAGNIARSHLRKRRREWERRVEIDEDALTASDGVTERDRMKAVRQVVGSLPTKQRQALLLRRYQGLSYEEVARVVGGSPAAARANVYQALRKLRKAFPEETR
jgi:RNA polymerase sigma-70 factor (ECF subfamily)